MITWAGEKEHIAVMDNLGVNHSGTPMYVFQFRIIENRQHSAVYLSFQDDAFLLLNAARAA
jgi:hypothetical protein